MKRTSRIPLRWRITMMTGIIVFASNLCMMLVSIYYANSGFDVVMTNVSYYYQNSMVSYGRETMVLEESIEYKEEETLTKNSENEQSGKNVIIVADPEVYHFDSMTDDLEVVIPHSLTDADAASSSVYFPDNSSVSRKFNSISLMTMVLTTLMGMAVAYALSARALRPIQQLNQSVLTITGNNLNRRVMESGADDEVGSLQKSFNGMMDRLESSFNRQKEFSRNVAHELKTPLTTMKTGIQVLHLDDHPTEKDMMQVLCITEKNIDRLISIVQDLLLFTNEERVEFNDEIDADALMVQILEEHKEFAKSRQVTLHLEAEQDCRVIQNEALLTRALNNLVENAIKYNEEQGRVDVKVFRIRRHVHVEIKDTGIGMDASSLERIWDPFYCVDESRSRSLNGAGIGLALVKSISQKCGFEVHVSSERHQGSTFEVIIPCELSSH